MSQNFQAKETSDLSFFQPVCYYVKKAKGEWYMTLEEQNEIILSGKKYNDLTPELIKAHENRKKCPD